MVSSWTLTGRRRTASSAFMRAISTMGRGKARALNGTRMDQTGLKYGFKMHHAAITGKALTSHPNASHFDFN